MHFTDGEWSTTFVPLGFTFAPEEDTDAIEAMVSSVLAAMQDCGVDLIERTTAVYLDGGAALTSVFQRRFPDATHVRCLQHVKKE